MTHKEKYEFTPSQWDKFIGKGTKRRPIYFDMGSGWQNAEQAIDFRNKEGGQLYSQIHHPNQNIDHWWWMKDYHYVNRTGAYAVVQEVVLKSCD